MSEDKVYKKKFWTKKKIIWSVILLFAAGGIAFIFLRGKVPASNLTLEKVKKQDIKSTVLATGQVVSQTDLQLSFKSSGPVARVNVKEGSKVKAGDVLASLEQKDQLASLTTARGAQAQAQANYNRVISGASSEEVNVYKVALENAKSALENAKQQQQVLVDNAYKALLNSTLAAQAGSGNTGSVTVAVSGTYTGKEQGNYKITIYSTGSGLRYHVDGLESGEGIIDSTPQPLGTKGLYILFSTTSVPTNNIWTVVIPNPQATTYVANYNAYQSALETQRSSVLSAENAVATAQANLDLKKAQARPADVQAAEAQILSARGQLEAAQAALENTIIRAPSGGTITLVDVKVGELATALQQAIVLQDVGNLHVEANISEANIAEIKAGQSVELTFDALGQDRKFNASVQIINPASTVVSGVVNYKVITSLSDLSEIKPGMTANLTILVGQKSGVLAVPSRAVIAKDGKKFVRVIDDPVKKTYREQEVQTGMEADGGLTEIISGLNEGEEIITFIKK